MSEQNLSKIAVTTLADQALTSAQERVNTGFEGGRVTKTDLASWLIIQATSSLDETTVEEIRRTHFNQLAYLETLVKKLKVAGRDNLETIELATLQAMMGQQTAKRRPRSSRTEGVEEPSHTT